MCGLIGISNKSRIKAASLKSSLVSLQTRGMDATGVAGFGRGELWFSKQDVHAAKFDFDASIIGATAIGHTRAATQGSPSEAGNNHPINCGHIVGAHNGMLWGERQFAERNGLKLAYEVDSEAIFRALQAARDLEDAAAMLNELEGDATIVWLDSTAPDTLYAAALGGRPAVWGKNRQGDFAVASTLDAVRRALDTKKLASSGDIPEGDLWIVEAGEIVEKMDFATIGWTWTASKRVDRSRANGPGTAANTTATLSTLTWSIRDQDQDKYGDWLMWADPSELVEVAADLMERYDETPNRIWSIVRNHALPVDCSTSQDAIAYETDRALNRRYVVHTGSEWTPFTRRAIEEAAEMAFATALGGAQ